MSDVEFNLIAAVACCNAYGLRGRLPWKLKDDLRAFKFVTQNSVLIMGSRTWHSLPMPKKGGPRLPDRLTIVVSRKMMFNYEYGDGREKPTFVCRSFDSAYATAYMLTKENADINKIWAIGGKRCWEWALKHRELKNACTTTVFASFKDELHAHRWDWKSDLKNAGFEWYDEGWPDCPLHHAFDQSDRNSHPFIHTTWRRKEDASN